MVLLRWEEVVSIVSAHDAVVPDGLDGLRRWNYSGVMTKWPTRLPCFGLDAWIPGSMRRLDFSSRHEFGTRGKARDNHNLVKLPLTEKPFRSISRSRPIHIDLSDRTAFMARSSPRATRSSTRLTMPSTKPASAMSKTKTSPSSDTSSVKPMTKPTPAPTSSLKRKRPSAPTEETLKPSPATKTSALATLEDGDADDQESSSKSAKKQKKKQEEKRPRMFRRKAPQSFLEKLERAQTQR